MTSGYRALYDLILVRLSPERAHAAALGALDRLTGRPRPRAWMRRLTHIDDELIRVRALGLSISSPLGV
ncbi:MAG: dihydroorotate dehydrogenase (quinone), partial [Acidobacteriota bacterium]|nr:dihydroorotate dehydrogenase (quinone) [Acidobacteriota bacterium]